MQTRVTSVEPTTNDRDHTVYDVILSGAGPVGLFLACELALAKCSVLVLERAEHPHSPLKQLPFGIRGLSAPTIETLSRRNLLNELAVPQRLKNPFDDSTKPQAPQARRQVGHFAGIPFFQSDIDASQWPYRLPSSTAASLLSELEELETVLARRAERLGVRIERGRPTTDVDRIENGVIVRSEDRSFHGRWLVGCDGSRSVVRKAAGFTFDGTEPKFTGYSAKIDIANPEKLGPGRNFTPAGMYFQSQPGYLVMIDFDGGAAHAARSVSLDDLERVLRRVSNTDVTVSAVHTVTTWTDRARQAGTYRDGRVLLAGDAAHIHAPLGGQGLNLGIGDAMNLGWKLAATIRDHAPDELLESYTVERHPIGVRVLDWSRAQVGIMSSDPHARALAAIVRDLMLTRDGATYVAGRVWGVSTQYDFGGDHPLIGRSVPNFAFEDGTTLDELMYDGRGILLDFEATPSLEASASTLGGRVKYVSRDAKKRFGLRAALIRPDGFVAWATDVEPNERDAEAAAARWFAR